MARTQGHGNPDWTREEVILALDLYFDCDGKIPPNDDPLIVNLSNLLRSFPYHAAAARKDSFRNPAGVAFKLQNLRQVATGKGLGNTSKTDKAIWEEFGKRQELVKSIADSIRTNLVVLPELESDENEVEFPEGRLITQLHIGRERNRNIRKQLIKTRKRNSTLICDICNHQPHSDPSLEDAVFEAHHVIPVATAGERIVRLSDMALLCANCHRLLHRRISLEKRWISVKEARASFEK